MTSRFVFSEALCYDRANVWIASLYNVMKVLSAIVKCIGWIFAFLLGTLAVLALTLYLLMWMFCNGPSKSARDTFVATMLETGNMKFVISWYLDEDEILAITGNPAGGSTATETDTSLIMIGQNAQDPAGMADPDNHIGTSASGTEDIGGSSPNGTLQAAGTSGSASLLPDEPVSLIPITGRTFAAQLLVVRDPSRVKIATCYPWSSMERERNGYTVGEYCENFDALAATNAGEFETPSGINWGGRPIGLVVSNGEVLFNEGRPGDVMVGFNEDHVLVIADVGSLTPDQFSEYVRTNRITDAASFKDISDWNNNHFTKLIMNGEAVDLNGKGGGANPRTAIGQCADGTVLILVTDGRGTAGHLGATGQDLINIMQQYGAVNAANLDGGSSSSLYYDGEYRITSSFLPQSDASRRLPTAFIVTKE